MRWAFLFIFCLTAVITIADSYNTVSALDEDSSEIGIVLGKPGMKLPPSNGSSKTDELSGQSRPASASTQSSQEIGEFLGQSSEGYDYQSLSSYILADLRYETYPDFSRIIFISNKKIDFVSYELKGPYRIVVDLMGAAFCELEEHGEYDEGLVEAVDIIKSPYVQQPEGMDKFFYAVDYVIITPVSEMPYKISSSDDEKVIIIDIGEKKRPQLKVSEAEPLQAAAEEKILPEHIEKPVIVPQKPLAAEETKIEKTPEPQEAAGLEETEENIIDYINCEALEDATVIVVISSNKDVGFKTSKIYKPRFGILVEPQKAVFTEVKKELSLKGEYPCSVKVIEDTSKQVPQAYKEYFYPVKSILIEPDKEYPFNFYSSDEGTISMLEIHYPKPEKESLLPGTGIEKMEPLTRGEVLKELKEDLKREGLLKQEEKIKLETSDMVERIGKEDLKELVIGARGALGIREAQQIAIENSPQAMTSREELKLANLKKREAFRALFPQLKLKGSHTTGDVLGVDFIEEVYGVQAEHPLYQGGRLLNTYRQAKINMKLAQAKYEKIVNDLDYKVTEAYYNTVTAVMNLNLQKELLADSEQILKMADERHKRGLSTKLEILNVKSRYNQIQFQLATAERDLALARFKLQQVMNLDITKETFDLAQIDKELKFKVLDIDLYKCLESASGNQPDILVNKLLVASNQYGEKIAKGKGGFKVDVTGFYGKSDSYYETESRNLQNDWNVGLKVSKPFWGNVPSYSFSKEETGRKVGQTDRTGSTAHVGELSILDKEGLSVTSEIKEAKINRQKAENDLIEVSRQTALEVKEAYYDYEEAIIQVKNALEKVRFQEEAVKVARAQAGLNEALQSQSLEALVQLVDEKALYVKALSDYNLAIAKLNKAIGISNYFKID